MHQRVVGVTVLPEFLQVEGVDAVLDNLAMKAGVTAVTTSPYVMEAADAATGVRRLEKIDLWEISVVTFPMLPGARVESVKTRPFAMAAPTEREFERWLTRDAGLTRMEARAILRSGFPGLKALRDASRTFEGDVVLASRFREAARLMQAM